MELDERVATAIRAHTDLIEPWAPDPAAIRGTARAQVRRRVAGGAAVLALAIGLAAALSTPGREDRSDPVVDTPSTPPAQEEVIAIPSQRAEQMVVPTTVRSTVRPGRRLVESFSSDDPRYDGSEIVVPLASDVPVSWQASCEGAPEAFFVVLIDIEATYFHAMPCDGRGVTLEDSEFNQEVALRMFVTEQRPREFRQCFTYSPPEGCEEVEPVHATESAARFGVRVYEHRLGPMTARLFGADVAARAEWNGTYYSVTAVAAAATAARELTFRLAASDRPRIAQATSGPTEAARRCWEETGEETCRTTLELTIDGEPVADQLEGPFGGRGGWGPLTPGVEHLVTLRVVRGDPELVDLGVVVYEED